MALSLPSIPEAVSDLKTLRLLARHAVEGTLSGVHRSGLFGSSIEFAEHKPYSPGDDLRHIDWKVYGRADKFYLKKYEDETNLRAYLVLDGSSSMDYGTLGYRKFDYAKVLTACLAYLFIQQHDLVGLLPFGATESYIPPRGRMPHFQILSDVLNSTEAQGEKKLLEALENLRERVHRKGVIIILSDFILSEAGVEKIPKLFPKDRYETHWIHILDPAELTFPFRHWLSFEGLEGEEKVETNATEVIKSYQKEVAQWTHKLRTIAYEHEIRYRLVNTNVELKKTLAGLLS